MATSIPKRTTPKFTLTHKTTITVIRSKGGERVKGKWIELPPEEIEVEANVQPLKGSELQLLPESERTRETIKVYCVETLRTTEEGKQELADIVVWNGKKYRATKTMTYQMGVLDHTKTICVRLPETPQDKASV